jgi:Copper binding periplasmic protein CusF
MRGRGLNKTLLAAGLALLAAAGCARDSGRDYTVRGQVRQLPDPANPAASGLYISHEAIDDWAGRSGEVEGMDPMNMSFEVAEGVSLEGIQPGDIVEFTLHADWEASPPVEITALRELPPGTRLVFREARPPRKK